MQAERVKDADGRNYSWQFTNWRTTQTTSAQASWAKLLSLNCGLSAGVVLQDTEFRSGESPVEMRHVLCMMIMHNQSDPNQPDCKFQVADLLRLTGSKRCSMSPPRNQTVRVSLIKNVLITFLKSFLPAWNINTNSLNALESASEKFVFHFRRVIVLKLLWSRSVHWALECSCTDFKVN